MWCLQRCVRLVLQKCFNMVLQMCFNVAFPNGMEKFHYFLYGKEFTLETDQKPHVSIYKKRMIDISPRVQRLIVRSFPYLPFKVVYKKGVDIPVADALSCVTPMDPEDNIKLLLTLSILTAYLPYIPCGFYAFAAISYKNKNLRL